MKVNEMTGRFTDALTTLNRVIEANRDKAVFGQLVKAGEKVANGLTISVGVYKTDPQNPYDYYTIRFEDAEFSLVEHGKTEDAQFSWNLSEEYINSLAAEPDKYVDNPLLVDWDWLRSEAAKLSG